MIAGMTDTRNHPSLGISGFVKKAVPSFANPSNSLKLVKLMRAIPSKETDEIENIVAYSRSENEKGKDILT
jgi:hypothetical protein